VVYATSGRHGRQDIGVAVVIDLFRKGSAEDTDSTFDNLDQCAVAVWAASRNGGEPIELMDWTPLSQPGGCISLYLSDLLPRYIVPEKFTRPGPK